MTGTHYSAEVACRNCGSKHQQRIPVGTYVTSEPCLHCDIPMLVPNNETWRTERANKAQTEPIPQEETK